ncbi:hypothetical protein MKY96_06345 [Paenibacillus sp. FSL R7-0302]|uniref:YncE family protein n=1 Tax=Paenibacillus sp. FSL R7-0302 TaxID=2921681 RepID=UPI0030FC6A74
MANCRRNLSAAHPYVYVSYEINSNYGYIAVIDPVQDTIVKRIRVGSRPGPMCMDPAEEKLFVVNTDSDSVTIIDTNTLKVLNSVHIGNSLYRSYPNAIFAAPKGDKIYVGHSGDSSVTIIDSVTNEVIKQVEMVPPGIGIPFAFAGNKNSSYVYVARTFADLARDRVVAIGIDDDIAHPYGEDIELNFEPTSNPLAVHPDGHTQVTLGYNGMLTYFDGDAIGESSTSSLLANTVSGVYTDDKRLFCTMREDRNYLKGIKNLSIDKFGIITYESFVDFPSYKGQDKIRLSRKQLYMGVTIQPTDFHTGGVQIVDLNEGYRDLVTLPVVGDLAFYSDTKAYVGELNTVRPIDVATFTALPAIQIGRENITVKNLISGYSTQS